MRFSLSKPGDSKLTGIKKWSQIWDWLTPVKIMKPKTQLLTEMAARRAGILEVRCQNNSSTKHKAMDYSSLISSYYD